MTTRSYRDLRVWSASVDLVVAIYELTSRLPDREVFGLIAQLRRAAVSIPSNIAEGQARASTRDFLRYIAISRGSLAEVDTQLLIVQRLGYLTAADLQRAHTDVAGIARMLKRLEQALRQRLCTLERLGTLTTNH